MTGKMYRLRVQARLRLLQTLADMFRHRLAIPHRAYRRRVISSKGILRQDMFNRRRQGFRRMPRLQLLISRLFRR